MNSAASTSAASVAHPSPPPPPLASAIATLICLLSGLVYALLPEFDGGAGRSLTLVIAVIAYLAGGIRPALDAIAALRSGRLNVDLLMLIAAAGAALIGDFTEGIVLLFLFSLSGTLESYAMYRTTRSIEALIRLRPREAWLLKDGTDSAVRVPIESLRIDDRLRVLPGERFPIDGTVEDGESWADESTLTGESEPIAKRTGDRVFAGTVNGKGSVEVRMTRAVEDTTLARIVARVREAQAQKTPAQRMVESWQQPYVIGVLSAALAILLGSRLLHASDWSNAAYHAMVFLVAASPCAVVVSSPSVMLSAIARAGRSGVLVKGGLYLELLGRVDVIAFDKTGTITRGMPAVTQIWTPRDSLLPRMLELAMAVEARSEHPLAQPVLDEAKARGATPPDEPITDFHAHAGLGVHGRVGNTWVGVGREALFESHEIPLPSGLRDQAERIRKQGQTALLVVSSEEEVCGVIGVADQLRPDAAEAIRQLKQAGARRIVMLTGDHAEVAGNVAAQVGVDAFRAGLLPEDKVMELGRLAQRDGTIVAMVGDGVNDAPALAAANIGIAMGGAGTDVALEVADVVLMGDDLRVLATAVKIGRIARSRVRQNLIFAFGMIGVLVLASFANLPLWLGVLGHEGSTVLVVMNGLRMLWQRIPK